jgi:hypothetical protein
MSFDLAAFSLIDMLQCGRGVRKAAASAESLDEAAHNVVEYLYANLGNEEVAGQSTALIRFYLTRPLGELDSRLQAFARRVSDEGVLDANTRCLTLVATAGLEPEWRDPKQSAGHQAIPLPSEQIVEQAPMISQLIREMGIEIRDVVAPDPQLIHERTGKTYNVFHVEDAAGSPYIPVQDEFVLKYGIRSVLGFGGLLPDGELFAVIVFARGPIPRESAERFRNIALDVKAIIHPFARPRFDSL